LISKRILEVERDNRKLEARTGKYKELAELLDKLGVHPCSYRAVTELEEKLEVQKAGMCQEVGDLLDGVIRDLQFKRQHLKNIGEGK